MADKDWTAVRAVELSDLLHKAPYRFGFFQALRQIECTNQDKPRIGTSTRPADDPIRIAQEPSLSFANSTISRFEPSSGAWPPRLTQRFLGLLGPNGPLPHHLTEFARDRLRNHKDRTFARFLDIFHHRMLTLFYRAWANSNPTVSFDRPRNDQFQIYIGSLFGAGMRSLWERDRMPDPTKLYFSGLLACQTRHADGLEAILMEFFNIPSRVEQFVGQWLELAVEDRWRLGESPRTGTLGMTAIVGSRVWNCQHKIRIIFGPMSYADYTRLLPGRESLQRLVAIVRNYVGDELDWDVQLILKKDEVPVFKLGQTGQLGWTTWSYQSFVREDTDALVFKPLVP